MIDLLVSVAADVAVRITLLAAAIALVLALFRIRSSTARHAAWTAVLTVMLLLPALSRAVPSVPVPLHRLAAIAMPARPTGRLGSSTVASRTESTRPAAAAVALEPASPTSGSTSPDAGPTSFSWQTLAIAAYAAGVGFLLLRLLVGLIHVSRIRRNSRPVVVPGTGEVFESPSVATPVTIGLLNPRMVLPPAWREWPADMVAAVVAHERAHAMRRDPLIALLARVNCALYWFHPVAWWLERQLAVTAEHACDDAAVKEVPRRRYAETLLEIAAIARRHQGRLVWQGVGVDGDGRLGRRIDRVLSAKASPKPSRTRRALAATSCVLVIAAVLACRQAVEPLREDPELAKRLVNQDEQRKRFESARDMTQEQADALEQRIALNPEDFDARGQLVTYYRTSSNVAWDRKVPGLRRHALWLVEHHPEHEIQAPALSPQFDPEGFAAAKKLWEAHLIRPDVSPFLVYRAASFFSPHDKPFAEQLILRGVAMDPDSAALKARMPPGVAGYEWPIQLSSLYAAALRGSESAWGTYNDLRTHLDKVNSPYAKEIRGKLQATTDAQLLARVGGIVTRPEPSTKEPALNQALDEVRALGIRYLERALELDPGLEIAKATLTLVTLPERATDGDRLAALALRELHVAEDVTEFVKKDVAAGKQQRDEAKARAEEVLKIAAVHAQDPAYAAAVMTAHHVLATVALRDGNRERAVHHMRESVTVPASDEIQYAPPFSWLRPVNRLLEEGERERVVEFLEAFARLTIRERDRLLEDARAIREGRMPSSYQNMVARKGR
ncbi:MAG TPA: M56 family metallopeptidase [Vicinamibacterales bacterium]|nr:M56 family metallopeptidase [Vicinamibacterales bacterium]